MNGRKEGGGKDEWMEGRRGREKMGGKGSRGRGYGEGRMEGRREKEEGGLARW